MNSQTSHAVVGVDPSEGVAALASSQDPFLIGVRHHSAALAAMIPAMLNDYAPDALLIELPLQAQDWIQWIASKETVAPIAFAGAGAGGYLAFYPFADFSPELVALRWARENNVPVICADAPMGSAPEYEDQEDKNDAGTSPSADLVASADSSPQATFYGDSLARRGSEKLNDMWDALVEAPAAGATPESIRVAALAIGWAHRQDEITSTSLNRRDAFRENIMRGKLADAKQKYSRIAALVGSFHAAALLESLPTPSDGVSASNDFGSASDSTITCSLVAYEFAHLDSRSGYPSGVKDPAWQQGVLDSALDPAGLRALSLSISTRVARNLRELGHPTGPAEIREAVRLSFDLASLRGNHAPSRRELHESFATVYAQGDVLGKGRAVARAAQDVLVGERRGRVDSGAPRSGLVVDLEKTMAPLKLPFGPELMREPKVYDLDPLRATETGAVSLDQKRQLTLSRLTVAGILYATPEKVNGIGGRSLTQRWSIKFQAGTIATVERAALRGVTLEQAAAGVLLAELSRQEASEGPQPEEVIVGLRAASESALAVPFSRYLSAAEENFLHEARLQDVLRLNALLAELAAGNVPGFDPQPWHKRLTKLQQESLKVALQQLEGLRGSSDPQDAAALAQLFGQLPEHPLRLIATVSSFRDDASPLMQGAAWGTLGLIAHVGLDDLAAEVSGWIATASTPEQRAELSKRLSGLCLSAGALFESGNPVMEELISVVENLRDREFLERVPSIRGGFDSLSPADRQRILDAVKDHTGSNAALTAVDPRVLLAWASADQLAWDALESQGLRSALAPVNRWRLLLGREHDQLDGQGRRYARSLDELYGYGQGEGVEQGQVDRSRGGGDEASFPSARVWADELETLYGKQIRQEVLAESVERGRTSALNEIDSESLVPSVELLSSVLNLAGALPESQLGPARALVRRMVEQLAKELANQLIPSLRGIAGVRTTRRKTARINLPATIRANLHTARRRPDLISSDGSVTAQAGWQIIPSSPVFTSMSNKSSNWDVIVLVDVSGSMEASTIFAALTSSILAGAPALNVHFIAFSTQIVDLSDHVADPLALLLEVSVGGGTDIAKAMRYAKELVKRPQRTLLTLISDFDEGGSVERLVSETNDLAASGVTMLGCAALDDSGQAAFNANVASQMVAAGMPVAAVTPQELTSWVGDVIRRNA